MLQGGTGKYERLTISIIMKRNMKKSKSIFYTLTKKPARQADKHKKKYIEIETQDYYLDEDEFEEEEFSEEEFAEYEDACEEEFVDEIADEANYEEQESSWEAEAEFYEYEEYDNSEEYYDEDDFDADEEEYVEEVEEYNEEAFEEEYVEEDYDDDSSEDDSEIAAMDTEEKADWKQVLWWRVKDFVQELTAMDVILTITTAALIIVSIMTINAVTASHDVEDQISVIAPVGNELSQLGVIGQEGLLAMVDAAVSDSNVGDEDASGENAENPAEEISQEQTERAYVNVNFESVEKDLKVRFKNSKTGELITGTRFEVVITNKSSGNKLTMVDDDQDGVIYASNIRAGKFLAVITSTDKYRFPTEPQEITIKDKVEYVVINVEDEVKKETEVEVAKEDTEAKQAAEEPVVTVKDTVEWVASTKTPVGGSEAFKKIDKSTIADPALSASGFASRMRFDAFDYKLNKSELTLLVGASDSLSTDPKFENSEKDGITTKYETKWTSSDESVAKVESDGKVTALKAGKTEIKCEVIRTEYGLKKVTTTETETVVEEISVEEYEKLSDDEKKNCVPIRKIVEQSEPDNKNEGEEQGDGENTGTEEGQSEDSGSSVVDEIKGAIEEKTEIVGYTYTHKKEVEVEKTEPFENNERVSRVCKVTVKDVAAESGTLELTASADKVAVKGTVQIKPSKLTYKKNDGTTETITENFPSILWAPTDISIATVDDKGVVTGVKPGKTTIVAKILGVKNADGVEISITASKEITVAADALTIALDKSGEVSLDIGKTLTAVATVKNQQSDASVVWTTSNDKVAAVSDKGVVTGVSVGKATITATTKEKDLMTGKTVAASFTVNVVNKASEDRTTKLKDKSGNQLYVKNSNGEFVEAVYADYYTTNDFYIKGDVQYVYTGWQTLDGKTYFFTKDGKPVTGTQVIQGVTYNFGSDGAILTTVNGATIGIDVSKWNGKIDWNAVKSSGVDYVIIRCGYRGSSSGALIEDINFKQNIQGATAAGLKVGVYFFSQAVNEVEAVKEASFAISLVQGYKLTYPIFIDTEPSGGRADNLSVAARTAVVNAFCQTIENAGYRAGVYTSKSWFEKKLNVNDLSKYKIWVARYAPKLDYAGRYDMWQYTDKGTVSGISGKVDMNYSYLGY